MNSTPTALFISALILVGCEQALLNLGTSRDGGFDASTSWTRAERCGNGLDDDQNGRIDDGCPCGPGETQSCFAGSLASRSIGICKDGVQTCRALGVEWGDWGHSRCESAVMPTAEQCDGMDHDCDGAHDEDCPCTAGETRECGVELSLGACRAGLQRCSTEGMWSECTGAIGPQAEVCGDGRDDDCDGEDEPCDTCVPEPETCRDNVDNDCDGVIDEPACTPDWLENPSTCESIPVDVMYILDATTDLVVEGTIAGDDLVRPSCSSTEPVQSDDFSVGFVAAEAGWYRIDLEPFCGTGYQFFVDCEPGGGCRTRSRTTSYPCEDSIFGATRYPLHPGETLHAVMESNHQEPVRLYVQYEAPIL